MTDIVERLRQFGDGWVCEEMLCDAADEIERLRKENELLRLGWCKESEKRMKEWQSTTVGTTGCDICNNAGHVEVTYLHQDGKFSTGWTKCTKCNT